MERCYQKNVSLAYPKHRFKPEDILDFVESKTFTADWHAAGFDDEDDLTGLQLCIMANPNGHELIEDTGGLRRHRHMVRDDCHTMVYFKHFEDFGVVFLAIVDPGGTRVTFTADERREIRSSVNDVEQELVRRKTIT